MTNSRREHIRNCYCKLLASGKIKIKPVEHKKIEKIKNDLIMLRNFLWVENRVLTMQERRVLLDVENVIVSLKILLSEEKKAVADNSQS